MRKTSKNYELQKINNRAYGYIIFSVNFYSPIDYLANIEEELLGINYSGKVLFDLLLVNGNSFNRYLTAEIKKGKFDKKSFSVLSRVPDGVKEKSLEYYVQRPDILRDSILPKPITHSILSGIK